MDSASLAGWEEVRVNEIRAEIEIDASAEEVWRILSDFPSYPEWNPVITQISGEARAAHKLKVHMLLPGGRTVTFHPQVLRFAACEELRWLWQPLPFGLCNRECTFRLERRGENQVHLSLREVDSGILAPLMAKSLEAIGQGFNQMNQALKERAEGKSQDTAGEAGAS